MNQKPNVNECLNCKSIVEANFCGDCGQSTTVDRITFKETIGDFFSSTFALEGPLLLTIKLLITNPGKLLRGFIGGKRKTYYKPVAFFVVLTAVYIILRSTIGFDPLQGQTRMNNPNAPEKAKIFIEASKFFVAYVNKIMFVLVLSIGVSFKMFFYKKYNLAEYTTVGFYVAGIYNALGMIYIIVSVYIIPIIPQTQLILLMIYLIYVSISLFQQKSIWSIFKYILFSIISVFLYVILGYGLSFLIVYLQTKI